LVGGAFVFVARKIDIFDLPNSSDSLKKGPTKPHCCLSICRDFPKKMLPHKKERDK